MAESEMMSYTMLARLLDVQPNQVYMWHRRRRSNGFPSAKGSVIVKQRPVPGFDPEEVKVWLKRYEHGGKQKPRVVGPRERRRNASGVEKNARETVARRPSMGRRRADGGAPAKPVEMAAGSEDVALRIQAAVSAGIIPPEHEPIGPDCEHLKAGNCPWCCPSCNYDRHLCGGCGMSLNHQGNEPDGKRHDCDTLKDWRGRKR